jgi:hypothetical protein
MKLLKVDTYKGYSLSINGEFKQGYYIWGEGNRDIVRLEYKVTNPEGNNFYIESHQFSIVPEKKPKKFLFWTIQPKATFEEDVNEELESMIEFVHSKIDKYLYEKEMTDGLLESLRN